ncbi:uncharacterized protein PAC_13779 [Phialocephala subalpina]|uniref:Uncharacterized protein n=1 Tax=Phialocephala subalpina TaxID=576137 RepID=A0A1L7XFT1_9HELO|nr:uncharacterized protein PAC_13779 [Phialocephala subalpina]
MARRSIPRACKKVATVPPPTVIPTDNMSRKLTASDTSSMASKSILPTSDNITGTPTATRSSKMGSKDLTGAPDTMANKLTAGPSEKMGSKARDASPDKMAIKSILNPVDTLPVSSKPPPPLIIKKLHDDILFMIFDEIIDSENTIVIRQKKILLAYKPRHPHMYKYHTILGPLSQSCHDLNDKIKKWCDVRKDLTRSVTFGLFNPLSTTFDFCYIVGGILEGPPGTSKIQRIYHPAAAVKHFLQLELWQRALWTIDSFQNPKIKGHACTLAQLGEYDAAWHKLNPEWQKTSGGSNGGLYLAPQLNGHLKDGVRDVLVLDWKKYREYLCPKAWVEDHSRTRSNRLQLGWQGGKQAFLWSDEWEKFEETRKIVSDDEVEKCDLNSVPRRD